LIIFPTVEIGVNDKSPITESDALAIQKAVEMAGDG